MNALTILLLVLISSFSCLAEMFDSIEFEENSNNRNRRDIKTFQIEIDDATYIDPTNLETCPTLPCVSALNTDWCGSFCALNTDNYGLIVDSLINCYKGGICERNFVNIPLTNVNISITSGSYDGHCYIHGDQVTMALINEVHTIKGYPVAAYRIDEKFQYDFQGLTLTCQPHLTCPTTTDGGQGSGQGSGQSGGQGSGQGVGFPCCNSSLLNQLICLVQQLVRSLGLTLNLLSCNCNCKVVSFLGKRQASDSPAINIPITVNQEEYFTIFVLYYDGDYYATRSGVGLDTLVNVGGSGAIPSQFLGDIKEGISSVFDDIDLFGNLQYNFYNVIAKMLTEFQYQCPVCNP